MGSISYTLVTYAKREYFSCIQLPKTKVFQYVHHIYLLAICYSKYIRLAFIYLPNQTFCYVKIS
jgi:hypothetical protein